VLEHFVYPEPLTTLLQECFRVLKIGGVFESGVPDFGKAFNLYSQGNEERFYAQKFWDSPNPNWCKGPIDELNWLVYMGGQHHFMFDNQNLVEILVEAGFDQVHLREYDPVFDSEERKHQSLYVKAIKTTSQSLNQAVHTGLQNNDAFAYDALWGNEGAVRLYAGPSRRLLWQQLARIAVDMEGVILDMGCGGGHLLALLSQQPGRRPEDLYGTDYSGEAIKLAHKQIPGAHLMKVTVYHLDFPANYFNIVFACETLEHLADPAAALKEGYRVLKPGGRFIITIPNGALDNWPGHAHFWDESQFRKFSRDYPIVHFEVLEQGLTLLFIFQKEAGN
jgi:ubiquinone/menaquinone biosynthesis C-methylase UbiE